MGGDASSTDATDSDEGEAKPYSGCGCCCYCVPAGHAGVVQWFGDFQGYTDPGLIFFTCPIQSVFSVSLQVKQITCQTDCKTKDNVTLKVRTAVQYRVDKKRIKHAVFDIQQPEAQIEASVDNVVRSSVPAMELDAAYENKETLRKQILDAVHENMEPHGYSILNVLITDLSPEAKVMAAMNEINAARRQREAAVERGEADKLLRVKAAEADAESKHLSGQGIARMRKAIADGFRDSMESMSQGGLNPQESMHMMVTTQYLDTLKDFANNPNSSSIMVPHGPGVSKDLEDQVRDGFIAASSLSKAPQQAAMKR
jgi:regulator of protease activity HflC (stomatin/prohibitin superfamily)